MNRIDRLSAILIQLQSKKVVKASEIAERFDISLRTVYRDIRALEEAGIPVGAEAGIGYFLTEGFHLPPVVFKPEEANALILGAKLIEHQTDRSIKEHFTSAMFKIKSVLDDDNKENLAQLENQIAVTNPTPLVNDDFPNNFISTIQTALIQSMVLSFKYYSSYNGDYSERQVEPKGLVYYGNRWHMLAYCRLRKAPRDFRVDRLVKLEMLEERFKPYENSTFEEFLTQLTYGTELTEVSFVINKEVANYISEQKIYQGYVSEEELEEGVKMNFLVPSIEYFSRWVVSLGDSIIKVQPPSLLEQIQQRISELNDSYAQLKDS